MEDRILLDQQLEATMTHLQLITQGVVSHRDATPVRALLTEFNKSEPYLLSKTIDCFGQAVIQRAQASRQLPLR